MVCFREPATNASFTWHFSARLQDFAPRSKKLTASSPRFALFLFGVVRQGKSEQKEEVRETLLPSGGGDQAVEGKGHRAGRPADRCLVRLSRCAPDKAGL